MDWLQSIRLRVLEVKMLQTTWKHLRKKAETFEIWKGKSIKAINVSKLITSELQSQKYKRK